MAAAVIMSSAALNIPRLETSTALVIFLELWMVPETVISPSFDISHLLFFIDPSAVSVRSLLPICKPEAALSQSFEIILPVAFTLRAFISPVAITFRALICPLESMFPTFLNAYPPTCQSLVKLLPPSRRTIFVSPLALYPPRIATMPPTSFPCVSLTGFVIFS